MKVSSIYWLVGLVSLLLIPFSIVGGCNAGPPPNAAQVEQDPISLSAQIDHSTVTVGQKLDYTLVLSHHEGIEVKLPDAGPKLIGLTLVDIQEEPPKKRDGRVEVTRVYHLRADQAGSYRLPEVVIASDGADWIAPSIFIEVASSPEDDADAVLADIKQPMKPVTDPRQTILVVGLLLLAALIALGLFWLIKRRNRKIIVPPPIPPWIQAAEALLALKKQGLLEDGDFRTYAFSLSEILRRYIEGYFGAPALEQTSQEILIQLHPKGALFGKIPGDLEKELRNFLLQTDQMKYAKMQPETDLALALWTFSDTFVQVTRPKPALDTQGDDSPVEVGA